MMQKGGEARLLYITVCVGSSCHLKGAYQVIKALQAALEKRKLSAAVELKAGFCLGHCVNGVAVQIGDHTLLDISPEQVAQMIDQYVMPEVGLYGSAQDPRG